MVAKRRLDFSKVTDMPVTKRVKILERKVRAQRPEMKHQTFGNSGNIVSGAGAFIDITAIQQGDNESQRSGNYIRVWRVEVRGNCSNNLDQFVLQSHNATIPTIANFSGLSGSMINDQDLNTQYTEWKHYTNNNQQAGDVNSFKYIVKFSKGLTVKYNGSTSATCVDNRLIWAIVNRSGVTRPMNATCRVWFTDA